MRRILGFFAFAVIAAFAAVWLASLKGHFDLEIGDWQIHMSAGLFVGAAALFALSAVVLARILSLIFGAPGSLGQWWQLRRRRRGEDALSRALLAAAAGDAPEIERWSKRVSPDLVASPLGLLLAAQAGALAEDDKAQRAACEAMLTHENTEFLGLKWLIEDALKRHDRERAIELADRAYALRPHTVWPSNTLFELRAAHAEWTEATSVLDAAAKARLVPPDIARRRRAVLLAVRATEAETSDPKQALTLALQALDLAPGLLPAAVLAARRLVYAGKDSRAEDIIEKAWSHTPHPDLAIAYGALHPRETAPERSERLLRLAGFCPQHFESCVLEAEQHIVMSRWADARRVLTPWTASPVPARICVLFAEIEERQHHDAVAARSWLLRGVQAPRDSDWCCHRCGWTSPKWSAICGQCSSFDTLDWNAPQKPGQDTVPSGDMSVAAAAAPAMRPTEASQAGPLTASPRPPDDPGPDGAGFNDPKTPSGASS
ncbi:MAG: hypothetical protein KGO02_13900 [Alphaproteobacteria bacterium]|nr:hypothetical protein [Alphaproteobacteria bacterium]